MNGQIKRSFNTECCQLITIANAIATREHSKAVWERSSDIQMTAANVYDIADEIAAIFDSNARPSSMAYTDEVLSALDVDYDGLSVHLLTIAKAIHTKVTRHRASLSTKDTAKLLEATIDLRVFADNLLYSEAV